LILSIENSGKTKLFLSVWFIYFSTFQPESRITFSSVEEHKVSTYHKHVICGRL